MKELKIISENKPLLTNREQECLYHIRDGLTAKEIARRMKISPRTVEVYTENLRIKTNCSNKTKLAVFAIKIQEPLNHYSSLE